jgi:membrane protease YdiL (CAAX protease family)
MSLKSALASPMTARVAPFAIYFVFLTLEAAISWLAAFAPGLFSWRQLTALWAYPVKTVAVLAALIYFWPQYDELRGKLIVSWGEGLLAVTVGVVVYLAWVLAVFRTFGAAITVPIMEELFWRSFLIRYLISPNFQDVRIGAFAPVSFIGTVALFGVEHNLWLAGMMAGVAYNLLLYRTGRLWPCIFAHGVTNGILACHVLMTGEIQWW